MIEDNKIVTIDLGTHLVRLDVANVVGGEKIEIVYHNDFPSAGISRSKVVNPAKLGAVLRGAVNAAENFLNMKIDKVLVGCHKCDIRSIDKTVCIDLDQESKITSETLETLKDMACEEVMNELDENETILCATSQCFNAGDEMGVAAEELEGMMVERLEGRYKIFTGRTLSEKQIDAAFREAGIDHIKPVFFGSEIGEAILSKNEMLNGAAIIDMGAGATSVYVFHAGVLRHYGSIPFGGNSISEDVRFLCDIDTRLAENIKLGYGGCMPEKLAGLGEKTLRIKDIDSGNQKELTAKYLSEIITARTREIIEAMLYEIQESGYADRLKNGIVLTGGCATMLNLCHYIKHLSGYNARLGYPSPAIFQSSSKLFRSPSSATTSALLLCGAKSSLSFSIRATPRATVEPGASVNISATRTSDGADEMPIAEHSGGLLGMLFDPVNNEQRRELKKQKEQERKAEKAARQAAKEAAKEAERLKKQQERSEKGEENGLFGSLMTELFTDDDN